jgi:cobalt/nickel transport system permease protein
MHIPDGFLDARTASLTAALSAAGLGIAVYNIRKTFPRSRVPLIGLAAAFIFAAQMLNFPVFGGTSGHLLGGVLAVVLLGPHAAVVMMSTVLILQCLLFADGGVTALGANLFNMAVLAPSLGFAVYRGLVKLLGPGLRVKLLATAFAAWCSTVAAAIACAGELSLSGIVSWSVAFPAMTNIHLLIGVGEALITTLVVFALAKARPELLNEELQSNLRPRWREILGYGMLISAGLLVFVAPFASAWPDGLERVAESLGFAHQAAARPMLSSPLPDYTLPGIESPVASTVIAGLIGLLVAFILAWLLARKLTPPDSNS